MIRKNGIQTVLIALTISSLGLLGGCGSPGKAKTDDSAMLRQQTENAVQRAELAADNAEKAADRAELAADKAEKMAEKAEQIFNKKMKK